MNETLKALCPIEIIKNLGSEALWMYSQAKAIKASTAEMTFEEWGQHD